MKTRLGIIDLFRGFAITAIVIGHFCLFISGINPYIQRILVLGGRGVQLFFMLSGWTSYLSYQSLENLCSNFDKQKNFYAKRLISILPCWYFILLVYQIIAFIWPNRELFSFTSVKSVIVNVLCLHGIIVADSPGWYIGAQMMLYFLFPYLYKPVLFIYNKLKKGNLWLFVSYGALLIISFSISVFFNLFQNGLLKQYINQSYTSFLCQLAPYITGIVLAYQYQNDEVSKLNIGTISGAILALIIAIISSSLSIINIRIIVYTWSLFFYLLISIVLQLSIKKEFHFDEMKNMINIGKNSYCIYLAHMPLSIIFVPTAFTYLQTYTPKYIALLICFIAYICLSVLLGYIVQNIDRLLKKLIMRFFPG